MLQDNEEWGLKHIYWNFGALKDILLQESNHIQNSNHFVKWSSHQQLKYHRYVTVDIAH